MVSSVKLTHVTPNAEDLIVYQARPHQPHSERADKLIRYLIKHKHWSPFEMASMGVEIFTQRDIAAQILRHRSFSFQEFSQRYADASAVGYSLPELRLQDTKNRQNSFDCEVPQYITEAIQQYLDEGQELYKTLLNHGYAKETCRRILPVCQNTRIFMTGSVRSWIHYLEVRTGPETQKEHRHLAQQIGVVFKEQFPNIHLALTSTND
jgi:thymidylate synthase (FAD)